MAYSLGGRADYQHYPTSLIAMLRGQIRDPFSSVRQFGSPGARYRARSPTLLYDRITLALLELVAQGRLAIGTALPSENRIAAATGASRTTVRSALQSLRDFGIIETRKGGRSTVIEGRSDETDRVTRLSSDYRQMMNELSEITSLLLSYAQGKAAQYDTGEDWTPAFGGTDPAKDEVRFLLSIGYNSRSRLCDHMLNSLASPLNSFLELAYAGASSSGLLEPIYSTAKALNEAIESRNVEQADRIIPRHFELLSAAFSKYRAPQIDDPDQVLLHLADLGKTRAVDVVAQTLKAKMIVYNLKPGELLPSERTLADQLGVSRASLRQALVMLKEQSWVETSEREGTRVGNALAREEVDPRAQSLQLLTDMCAVRGVIEPWVLRRAATPDKQKNISYLKRVLNETSRSNRSERLKSMDDLFFHQAIALTSCSSIHLFLAEVTQDTQQDYFDYSRNELYVGDEIDHEVIAHHAAMVRHIEACDPEQAADWQKEHTRVFKSAYANSSKM